MDILGGFWSGVKEFASTAAAAAIDVCQAIGGETMLEIVSFIGDVALAFGPEIAPFVTAAKIIVSMAYRLLSKPEEETPEELGLRAEIYKEEEGMTPESFHTTEEYISHLRENIQVDRQKLDGLSDMDRQKYAMVGVGLYNKQLGERYGIDLVPEFWRAVVKSGVLHSPENASGLLDAMKRYGVKNGGELDAFLARALDSGSAEMQTVYDALEDYLQARDEGVKPDELPLKINELFEHYGEKEDWK